MADIYKNISDSEQTVPGAGVWKAGEEKESPIKIENPNFKQVNSSQPQTQQPQKQEPFSQKEGDK